MTNSKQIAHGDEARREENFDKVDHTRALANIFVARMLTSDLFAVANLASLPVS